MNYLGVIPKDEKTILFAKKKEKKRRATLKIYSSEDGINFKATKKKPVIKSERSRKRELVRKCEDFKFSKVNDRFFLNYKRFTRKNKYTIKGAFSKDLVKWEKFGKLSRIDESGVVVPDFMYKGKHVIYFGAGSIKMGVSKSLKRWKVFKNNLISPRKEFFDNGKIDPVDCFLDDDGINLFYSVKKDGKYQSLGKAVFDKENPKEIIKRCNNPAWVRSGRWGEKEIRPLGVLKSDGRLFSYWAVGKKAEVVELSAGIELPAMKKFDGNPIIEPRPKHSWESKATFNAAAVYEEGKVHILYRSIGDNNQSVLGYASSKDGVHIDERLEEPAFVHTFPKGHTIKKPKKRFSSFYSPVMGWMGGCEDPRITKIGDRFYMTFVSFDAISPPRVALTSIKVKDFLDKEWNWEEPVLISPPGIVDKNAVIFPEKIKGKYVIMHRIFPLILIDFVDDLNYDGNRWLEGQYFISPREKMWDSRKVGAGPPPIKTKDGWLLIYHGVGDKDPLYRYRIGAMVLDKNDPTKVLYRCEEPIIEPEGDDANIAYPCGAAVIDNRLFVYYGSADIRLKVATADLDYLLDGLKASRKPKIKPVNILSL